MVSMAKEKEAVEKTPEQKQKDKEKADYYMRLREIRETKKYYDEVMDKEGRDFTFLIGQVFPPYQEFLKECGFSIEDAGHITWKLIRPPKVAVETSDESKSED
jgi:hypothetical protein